MIVKFHRICIVLVRRIPAFIIIFLFGVLLFKLSRSKSNENAVVVEFDVYKKLIFKIINAENKEQKITNINTFGAVNKDTLVFVIMVDKYFDSGNMKILIDSLNNLKGIDDVLIIFSHSYYDVRIKKLIENIDFCRVLQIYYPFSVQLYPNKFPGLSFNDCPYNMSPKKAVSLNCTGAHTPDVNSRYRVPNESQKKHHWWWTANIVFEKLSALTEHTGIVIFLDDNLIFMKDFIYMATYMKNIADLQPRCELLSFGKHSLSDFNGKDFYENQKNFYGIELSFWDPKKNWNILGFDLYVWNSIVPHYDLFCSFDDSSWLRSLYYVSVNRKDGKRYKTLSCMAPRAFRVKRSYMRYELRELSHYIRKINEFEERNMDNWFPPFLELYIALEFQDSDDDIYDMVAGNGGFADPRDIALCHNMTVSKIKKVVLDMKYEFRDSV